MLGIREHNKQAIFYEKKVTNGMSATYINLNKWIDSFHHYINNSPWFLALFHMALRVIFGHYWCSSRRSSWKEISEKYNINTDAFLFWSLIELNLFCGSTAFSVLLRKKFFATLQIPSPWHSCQWQGRPNYTRRLSAEGKIPSSNKKVIKFGLKSLLFLMLASNQRNILLVTNRKMKHTHLP